MKRKAKKPTQQDLVDRRNKLIRTKLKMLKAQDDRRSEAEKVRRRKLRGSLVSTKTTKKHAATWVYYDPKRKKYRMARARRARSKEKSPDHPLSDMWSVKQIKPLEYPKPPLATAPKKPRANPWDSKVKAAESRAKILTADLKAGKAWAELNPPSREVIRNSFGAPTNYKTDTKLKPWEKVSANPFTGFKVNESAKVAAKRRGMFNNEWENALKDNAKYDKDKEFYATGGYKGLIGRAAKSFVIRPDKPMRSSEPEEESPSLVPNQKLSPYSARGLAGNKSKMPVEIWFIADGKEHTVKKRTPDDAWKFIKHHTLRGNWGMYNFYPA